MARLAYVATLDTTDNFEESEERFKNTINKCSKLLEKKSIVHEYKYEVKDEQVLLNLYIERRNKEKVLNLIKSNEENIFDNDTRDFIKRNEEIFDIFEVIVSIMIIGILLYSIIKIFLSICVSYFNLDPTSYNLIENAYAPLIWISGIFVYLYKVLCDTNKETSFKIIRVK